MPYVEPDQRLHAISWGSVIAGALTVLAISLLLSFLISGLGLGQVDLPSDDPLAGVSATVRWTTAISLLVSLAAGGYLSGYLSGVAGWVHGFLTWALAMLVAAYLSVAAAGAVFNVTGAVVGGAANATGTAASAAGDVVGGAVDLAGNAATNLAETLEAEGIIDLEGNDVATQLREAAGDVELDALQPDLIQDQLTGARDDIVTAGEDLLANPQDFDTIADDLVQTLRDRVATLESEIDRDALVVAISDNTTLTDAEVEDAADRAIALYQDTADQARDQLNAFEQRIVAAQDQFETLQAEAIAQADLAADAAASAALWAFFGALLGGLVAIGAGIIGARSPVDTRTSY